ncbi:hypothetical protein [Pseudomonas sp. GOM6]|uniref:hypothetical protein n=1 Tax=Pseudomonas sp. GOM6 TaxID=3036944 RepID=UPI0024091CFD|nr:hypothetical protein [Pseudomonas sp. GOM6]MDG1580885.1 hypothetical protein [Pseudomonas sp. GOM6]
MDLYATKRFIAEELARFGWEMCDEVSLTHFCGVATKCFETAVGPKSALVLMEPYFGVHALKAEYWSEGRNVLSTMLLKIDIQADQKVLVEALPKFAEEVEKHVGQSYAVRLHRSKA